jgi:hypothetical protein
MSDIEKAWKGHQFDWTTIAEQTIDKNFYVCLNQREMAMILGALTPTLWRTRWLNLPDTEDLDWIVQLKAKLLCSNGCCDGVEECVRDSEGIREIIREIIKETTIEDPTRPLGGDNPAFDGCPPDVIFGGVTSLVDTLNQSILDTLEIIEVYTNPLEALNLAFDNNPVTGLLSSRLIETIDWIISNVAENYAANYTIGLRDTYRCDLFCLWKESEDCSLSLADVAQYFQSRVASAPSPLQDLSPLIGFLVGGFWSGPEIVDIMHLLCVAMLTASDRIGWLPIGNGYGVELAIALGANNPDSDWMILCDECVTPEWCYTWDFTANDGGWTVYNLAGVFTATYQAGVGWRPVNVTGGGRTHRAASIKIDVPVMANITSVEIEYDFTIGSFVDTTSTFVTGYEPPQTDLAFALTSGQPSGVGLTEFRTFDIDTAENFFVFFRSSVRNIGQTPNGDVTIRRVTLRGTGLNPFGTDNC